MTHLNNFINMVEPFLQDTRVVCPEDIISYKEYTNDLINNKTISDSHILTKDLVDDVKGYCEVHDIDINLYRYAYTCEASPDFFDDHSLEWNLLLNGVALSSYEDTNIRENYVTYEEIDNKLGHLRYKEGDLHNIEIDPETGIPNFFLGDNSIPILPSDEEAYKLFPEENTIDQTNDTITSPYVFIATWLKHFPKTKRYLINEKEISYNNDYDDDTTNHKNFREDKEFLNKKDYIIIEEDDVKKVAWPKFRFAIIHGHFYIFSINKLLNRPSNVHINATIFRNLICVKPNTNYPAKIIHEYPHGMIDEFNGDSAFIPLKYDASTKTIKISDLDETAFFLAIDLKYVKVESTNVENLILGVLEKYHNDISIFKDGKDLSPKVIASFFRYVKMNYILLDSIEDTTTKDDILNKKVKVLTLYDLSGLSDTSFMYILYSGMNIQEWAKNILNLLDDYTIFLDELDTFKKLTKNKCKHLIPNVNDILDIPYEWTAMKDENELVDRLRLDNYDIFMEYSKLERPINIRIKLEDAELNKKTSSELVHRELPNIEYESAIFFKWSIPNFRRNPYDIYICNLLYDGQKFIDREHHWDHIYIPVAQLYKWLKYNNLGHLLTKYDDKEEKEEGVYAEDV